MQSPFTCHLLSIWPVIVDGKFVSPPPLPFPPWAPESRSLGAPKSLVQSCAAPPSFLWIRHVVLLLVPHMYINGPVFVFVQMNFNGWSSSNDQHHVVLSCTIFQPRGSIIIEASNVDSFRHSLVSCSPDAAMKCWPGCNTARPDLRFGIFRGGLKLWGGPFPWTAAACSRTESVNSPRASNNVTLPASGCPSGFEKGAVAPTKALVLHDIPCFFWWCPLNFHTNSTQIILALRSPQSNRPLPSPETYLRTPGGRLFRSSAQRHLVQNTWPKVCPLRRFSDCFRSH